jgi:Ni/Co efflux regulator RcnB
MKNLLISVFALSLATAAPTALLAQQDNHKHDQGAPHDSMGGPSGHGTPAGGPAHNAGAMGGDHHTSTMYRHATTSSGGTGSMGSTRHTYRHRTTTTTSHMTMDRTMGHRSTTRVKVDVSAFHKNFDSPNHYHYGDYHGPAGYSYHRWGYGDNLPREYWAQNFWIGNFLNFGLMAPPDGYVWVRYGPDAVLIDEDTGEVVQVEYGVFY